MSSHSESHETLEDWAGSQYLSLGLVFTDIVASTEIGIKLGDKHWTEQLFRHLRKDEKSLRVLIPMS